MNRRTYSGVAVVLVLAIALLGCSSGSEAAAPAVTSGETYASDVLTTDYEGALAARNQLALGTLELQGTADEVTPEQAAALLPLWQALRGTTRSGAAATAEVEALLAQIEEVLMPDQLQAIADLQLTQDDLRAWATASGIALGTGEGAGSMGGGGGMGRGLSEDERATRQAASTGGGTGGLNTALLDAVITYLGTR